MSDVPQSRRVQILLRTLAAFGAVVAAALMVRAGSLRPDEIVAFASLAVVPLAFALAIDETREGTVRPFDRGVAASLPIGSVSALASWIVPRRSFTAIAGASGYAIVCAAIGLVGLRRLLRHRTGPIEETTIDFGLLFLPIGAGWMLAARAGWRLLGFGDLVVILTAAHFHYAGFAAPIVFGSAGRLVLATRRAPLRSYRIAAVAVCAGVPLTAIGIATTRVVETGSALALAAGVLVAAFVLVRDASRESSPISPVASALWAVSGTSLMLSMALAATFATTGSAGRSGTFSSVVTFERMLALHGAVNAFGFVTTGLVAASIVEAPKRNVIGRAGPLSRGG